MKKLARSFGFAFRGIWVTLKSQRHFRLHIIALVVAIAIGVYVGLEVLAWGLVLFAIGFVLVAELFNTAMEHLGDEASGGKQSELIRNAKDIAAAAVLLSAATALVIGILVLFVPLVKKLIDLF